MVWIWCSYICCRHSFRSETYALQLINGDLKHTSLSYSCVCLRHEWRNKYLTIKLCFHLTFFVKHSHQCTCLPWTWTCEGMGLLPDTKNCGLCMRRECRERFPRHRLQMKPLVSDPGMHHGRCVTRAVMHVGIAYRRWRHYFLDRIIFRHDFHHDSCDHHWDFYGH